MALTSFPAFAAKRPDPVVLTLDGRHYVSDNTISLDPTEHLVLAPDARLRNCRRVGNTPVAPGTFDLVYSDTGDLVNVDPMWLHFNPTQLVMTTPGGDMVCDNEAMGWQTGFDRIFRADFDEDES